MHRQPSGSKGAAPRQVDAHGYARMSELVISRVVWRHAAFVVKQTESECNRNYHRPWNTHETLDYERMAMVVRGVYAAILAFG